MRERIGKSEEEIAAARRGGDAWRIFWLAAGAGRRISLTPCSTPKVIRVALDQEHVDHEEPLAGAREIALFPPMTGG